MPFSVVLAGESLTANSAYERALIGVSSKMGAQIVGTGESLGAEVTLEGGWMLLDSLVVPASCGCPRRIGQVKDGVSVGDG